MQLQRSNCVRMCVNSESEELLEVQSPLIFESAAPPKDQQRIFLSFEEPPQKSLSAPDGCCSLKTLLCHPQYVKKPFFFLIISFSCLCHGMEFLHSADFSLFHTLQALRDAASAPDKTTQKSFRHTRSNWGTFPLALHGWCQPFTARISINLAST